MQNKHQIANHIDTRRRFVIYPASRFVRVVSILMNVGVATINHSLAVSRNRVFSEIIRRDSIQFRTGGSCITRPPLAIVKVESIDLVLSASSERPDRRTTCFHSTSEIYETSKSFFTTVSSRRSELNRNQAN